jgi:plasmid stability protein
MKDYSITLELPDDVYEQLRQRAAAANRTVEEEIIALLEIAFPEEDDPLSEALEETLESLELLDNAALWAAAQSQRPEEVAAEMKMLHQKQERESLTDVEQDRLEQLAEEHQRLTTIRDHVFVLLKERGYDISDLV